ncbi:MAG TPA: polysaccharide biosynthesis protein, partial [Atribacteraceae bacterium]|nr:polysaccharide biosynthesis protein [Atribacteraceae bacterium]
TGCRLIVLDHNETGIFDLVHELGGEITVFPLIGDIRCGGRLKALLNECRPDFVYHAAAYKHVPLLEENPAEAFLTNVAGTLNLLEACRGVVGKVVFISTDKAVHPENVMGQTKKIGEVLIHSFAAAHPDIEASVVRFGNVLGSRGNVLEVWKAQLERGEPLTITDPAMKRYFMTTQEAVTLVIEVSLMAGNRRVYVLKMGEMLPIVELARIFCEIQGYQLGRDVELRVTGKRAGEKMMESLWEEGERVEETTHPRIWRVRPPEERGFSWDHIARQIRCLEQSILAGDTVDVREAMRKIVGD